MRARIHYSRAEKLVNLRQTEQGSIILQYIKGITLPKKQCLQLPPSLLISPMLTKHVSRIDSSWNVNKAQRLGSDRLADYYVPGSGNAVPLV